MDKTTRRYGRLLSVIAIPAFMGVSLPAHAQTSQEPAAAPGSFLGRIILGFGRARTAIDTPQAVSTLEQEDIDREQAATPGDLLRTVPGATVQGGDRMTGQHFNIRGIGGDASDQNRIIVTVDGVEKYGELYRVGQFFGEPELYKRVEILRGPASSALYGSGALGGVVAFETKDAADFLQMGETTALRVKAGANTNGGGALGSVILAQRFGESFEMLAALNHRRAGDHKSGDGTKVTGSGMAGTSGLLKGTYRFGDNNEQTLSLSWSRWLSDEDGANYSATSLADAFGTVDRKAQDDTATLLWTNPASGNPMLDSRVQLSYSRTLIDQENAVPGMPALIGNPLFEDSFYQYRTLALRAENRFTLGGEGWENYLTLGVTASEQRRTARRESGAISFHPEGTDRRYGLFLQNEFIWDDRLTAVLGLRADRVTLTPSADVVNGEKRSHTARVASLALHYKLNDDWAVFGSVSQTERAPSIDEMFDVASAAGKTTSLDLRPERARTLEAGFSYGGRDLFAEGDSLDFKLTVFSNRVTDKIERPGNAVPGPTYANIARAHIRGIEIEGGYDADTVFTKFAYSRMLGTDQTTGARLNSTPQDELVLELGARAFDQTLEYGWRGTFARRATRADGDRFPGYGVNDLYATWRPDQGALAGLEMQLAVNNVLNKQYHNILDGMMSGNEPRRGRDIRLTVARNFTW
ncbi:TonB-dependent receptor domain-containing protein [Roseinatronobacter alkalisoli]|uniref:TonB-dependent receptor n=1 Tax=Roseinatronobacter alkalisoli TaxID=3028235 RepID=A0ABT5T3Z0_9RHOB|nr:TonB-dependent receptor [Roseinatronobacter sp. HJB301]MDD7969833.1 TonB-dependent receptor [Roseinatronobacter sp. HJB301]